MLGVVSGVGFGSHKRVCHLAGDGGGKISGKTGVGVVKIMFTRMKYT